MPTEPAVKKVFTFVDGQNLFRSVKEAFGYGLGYRVDEIERDLPAPAAISE